LKPLFELLKGIFSDFGEIFNIKVFIYGFKDSKTKRKMGSLLNFIVGQVKMSIYASRKQKIEHGNECNIVSVFKGLVKARIKHDFSFYLHMNNLWVFEKIWTYGDVLCKVENNAKIYYDELR